MSVIFGPVPSRRLGYSLGVDLVPADCKTCTLDCYYCQVGHTKRKVIERAEYISTGQVLKEIDAKLPVQNIHFITFSGSGEPTLHKDHGRIIDRIRQKAATPVAVITNGTLMDRADVRRDLAKADLVVPSLDAVSPEVFARLNRPHPSLDVGKIIEGLEKFRQEFDQQLWLEVMMVRGFNDHPSEIMKFKQAIDRINPDRVHLNTVTRPPVEKDAEPLQPEEMDRIAAMFGSKATVIGVATGEARQDKTLNLEEQVFELVRRRGVTLNDLVNSHGLHRDVAADILERLVNNKKIKKVIHGGVTYYREYY